MVSKSKLTWAALLSVLLSGCATNPKNPVDPYEPYNRQMFRFNEAVYKLAQPVIDVYDYVPLPVRSGLRNVVNNIEMIPTIANDLLQFNFKFAGQDLTRFFLNSTLGVFGLVDVAQHVGLYDRDNGFGMTLAKWGATQSPYLILPFLGPSTGRDMLGFAGNFLMSPTTYVHNPVSFYAWKGAYVITKADDLLPKQQLITKIAVDPYVAMRNAYLQNVRLRVWQVRHPGEPLSNAPMKVPHQDLFASDYEKAHVKISHKPVSNDNDMSPALRQMMKEQGSKAPLPQKTVNVQGQTVNAQDVSPALRAMETSS